MTKIRLLKLLPVVLCLGLPIHAAPGLATTAIPTTLLAGVCASVATCDAEIDQFRTAHNSELLAMALWGKIAALQRADQSAEAKNVREYLVALLAQTHGPEHAYTVAGRSAAPEVGMQALLPAWQKRQQQNAELATRRVPILEHLRTSKNMVKIAEAYFEIGKYEVTQAEWEALTGTNPSHFKGCLDCPVESIDGETVRAFLTRLNQLTGKQYRLPTAEEWRLVFEAGFSGTADENAWHAGNAGGRTHPVGQKKPNVLGLYDLHGNVSEWVEETGSPGSTDDDYLKAAGTAWDGKAPEGFWNWIRSSAPRYPTLGFRLAHSLEKPPAPKNVLPACHDLPDAPKPGASNPETLNVRSPASLPKGFRDCPDCPEMVTLPAGRYMDDNGKMAKMPAFAIARTEITVGQFRRFVDVTGHRTSAEVDRRCNGPEQDWRRPSRPQSDTHPAVCVSGVDAKAYVDWLNTLTGQVYQLPTDAQWEYAARANSPNSAIWGDDIETACRYANVSDRCFKAGHPGSNTEGDFTCIDGYVHSAPVGRYPPNAFGLYDMIGNVAEWTVDSYCQIITNCGSQNYRGGSASDGPGWANFYRANSYAADTAWQKIGFRPVRVAPR